MTKHLKSVLLAMLSLTLAASAARAANGDNTQWQKKHPRRTQVNKRIKNERSKNGAAVQDGKLTKGQGAKLNREDHAIRQEERDMAAQNGGHITKQEQRTLNRQENKVNRQRNRMEQRDASQSGGQTTTPPPAGQ